MPGTQELTRRIKSVKSTRKVTRAMQMVSAAKMRKSQAATMASRTYSQIALDLIKSLDRTAGTDNPLVQQFPSAMKLGVVIISSNRGLVGSFNQNLMNMLKQLELDNPDLTPELIVVGRKVRDAAARLKKSVVAEFEKQDTAVSVSEVYPLAKLLAETYRTKQYRKIVVVYNHFVSTLVQTATAKQLLPLIPEASGPANNPTNAETIYEPNPAAVLNHLLPRIIESQLYQAVLENNASENSARMVMMKNATEAAGDLISDLTLTFNQLRQNKITTELSEITAGKLALESKS